MACAGTGLQGGFGLPHASFGTPDGPFFFNSAVRLAQVRDGLSQTAFFSETIIGEGAPTSPTLAGPIDVTLVAVQVSGGSPVYLPLTEAECRQPTSYFFRRNSAWVQGDFQNALYTHYLTPNSRVPDCLRQQYHGWKAARSRHPGGVNLLMGDGSARFVKDTVASATWRAMATRGGGEVISADQY
jgi:prepilin-type processing-associated H-X9-DG protein